MSIALDVGTPPEGYKEWTHALVRFHGFANLPITRDEYVESPEFSCFGHQWVLKLYPGGRDNSDEGYVAIGIVNRSNTSIKIQYCYSVRDADGKEVMYGTQAQAIKEFGACGSEDNNARCKSNFALRLELLESLVDGALVIEVRMKSTTTTGKSITQFIPTNPFNKNVDKLFMDGETADVLFEVGGEQATGTITRKKSKTTTNFHAHRILLKNNASALYEMCKSEGEGITTVSITDVKPEIFKFIYALLYIRW